MTSLSVQWEWEVGSVQTRRRLRLSASIHPSANLNHILTIPHRPARPGPSWFCVPLTASRPSVVACVVWGAG